MGLTEREKAAEKWQKRFFGAVWRCYKSDEVVMHLRVDELEQLIEHAKHQDKEEKVKIFIRPRPGRVEGRSQTHTAYVLVEKGGYGWVDGGYKSKRPPKDDPEPMGLSPVNAEKVDIFADGVVKRG